MGKFGGQDLWDPLEMVVDRKGKLLQVGCARAEDETGRLYLMGLREKIKDLKLTYLLPQLSVFYSPQVNLPNGGTTHNKLGPPAVIVNQEEAPEATYRPFCCRCVLS